MLCVLLAAGGASWEAAALTALSAARDVVVLKRCVDVDDLLAAAATGQADIALVALDAPDLDAAAVDRLRRHQVRTVAVTEAGPGPGERAAARAARIGVRVLLPAGRLPELPALLASLDDEEDGLDVEVEETPAGTTGVTSGRVVAVWGPAGAPGRSTVAVGIAAELARRVGRSVLVDADPYGGAIAPQLGILDEVSGLLAAARLAATGSLEERLPSVLRTVGGHGPGGRIEVVTGLPRADRWVEVRPGAVESLLGCARRRGHVVVDTGFSLETDGAAELAGRPSRNGPTLAALEVADDVVVVGTPDPVGLSRLARGLVDLRELAGPRLVHVVVNRQRSSLGWSQREVVGLVEGFARVAGVSFLPDDTAAMDRALVAGQTLVEAGESALSRALGGVVDALFPGERPPPRSRVRRRTPTRARAR